MPEFYDTCFDDDTIHGLFMNRKDLIVSQKAEIISLRAELEYYKAICRVFEILLKENVKEVNHE